MKQLILTVVLAIGIGAVFIAAAGISAYADPSPVPGSTIPTLLHELTLGRDSRSA
jgi:hypothetical protein